MSLFAGLIQAATDGVTGLMVWRLARDTFFPGEEAGVAGVGIGWMAGLGWALYEPAQAFCVVLMPTSLAVAGFWYCVWVVSRERRFTVWKPWLGLGLLIGVEAMIVATILFLIPLGLVAIVRRSMRDGTHWLRAAGAAAVLLAGVGMGTAPCWVHNYFVAHEPVALSAHSGFNFYIGNNGEATGYPHAPAGMRTSQAGMLEDSILTAERAAGHPLKHYEVSRYWAGRARAYIAGHPWEWVRLLVRKAGNFWRSFQYDDLNLISYFKREGVLAPGLSYGLVAVLGLAGMVVAMARRQWRAGWIAGAVLLQMGALLPVFVTERYRMAAVPGLLLLGAYGVWEFWRWVEDGRWGPAAAYGCAGAVLACWVGTPPGDASLWCLDPYNIGVKEVARGQYAEARVDLERAYRYMPENAEVNFALGLLWQHQGDVRRAETFYGRALELNPRHEGAWNNLGVLASKSGVWAAAERCFSRAIAIEPADVTAQYLEARACARLGRWDEAGRSIARAESLRPGCKEFEALAAVIATRGPLPPEPGE